MRQRAIELIRVEDGQFIPNEKALKKIFAIEEPIGIVSIVGLYRTGKSFLLNQLIGKKEGFKIASSIRPCTKGLWVHGDIFTVTNKYDQTFKLLFVDSEGIGSFSANETQDAQIFALSLLLSSMFLYNSLGNIDDNAIQRLGMVTQLSQLISKKAPRFEDDDQVKPSRVNEEITSLFPSFVWVVRDFVLELLNERDESINSDEYLEMALRTKLIDTGSKKNRLQYDLDGVKNEIKTILRDYFPDRHCFTLVRPISDEKKLQRINSVGNDELRPVFKTQIAGLKRFIFENVKPKTFKGTLLNGRRSIIVDSCWDNVIKTECNFVFLECKRFYKRQIMQFINEGNIVDIEKFEEIHTEIEDLCLKKFHSKSIGEEKYLYERELKKVLVKEYRKFKRGLKNASVAFCGQVLRAEVVKMQEKLPKYRTFEDFENDLGFITKKYELEAKGSAKCEVLQKHLLEFALPSARNVNEMLMEKLKEEHECMKRDLVKGHISNLEDLKKKYFAEKEQMDRALGETRNRNSVLEAQMQKWKHREDKFVRDVEAVKNKNAKLVAIVQQRDERNREVMKEKEKMQSSMEKAMAYMQELKKEARKNREKEDEFRNEIYSIKMEYDSVKIENGSLKQTIEFLEERNGQLAKNNTQSSNVLTEIKFKLEDSENRVRELEGVSRKCQEEIRREKENGLKLRSKNSTLKERIKILDNEMSTLRNSLMEKEGELDRKHSEMNDVRRRVDMEKERMLENESKVRRSLREKERFIGMKKRKILESQVEQLNSTNRRILEINKKVMDENKALREELISCGGSLRSILLLQSPRESLFLPKNTIKEAPGNKGTKNVEFDTPLGDWKSFKKRKESQIGSERDFEKSEILDFREFKRLINGKKGSSLFSK